MSDDRLPDLPSDEELGIDGLDEDELLREFGDDAGQGAREAAGPEAGHGARADGGALPPAGVPRERGSSPRPPSPPPPSPPPPGGPKRSSAASGPPSGPGGGSWAMGLVTLVVLLLGAWLASSHRSLPAPKPANVPDTVFSSARAMAQLVDLARAPRPVGSPEHERARELVTGWLEDLGLEVQVQTRLSLRREAGGASVRGVTVRNLLARIPGQAVGAGPGSPGTGAVLLTAHYDAVPLSHGAGDAGVGVVAIVEAARALLSGPPLANDVILLITDAEEIGLLGARAFVEAHPWMSEVRVVLSAEMRGVGGPVYMFETGAENGWILPVMQAADPRPLATSFSVEVYRRLPNNTDFTPFREAGVQGLNFAGIGRAWAYHQPTDRPGNVQEATIQHVGERLLALTRELGNRDLTDVHAPDLVYLTLPVVGIVAYPKGLALPLSAGIFLLWIGVVLLAVARGRSGEGARAAGATGATGATGSAASSGAAGEPLPRRGVRGWTVVLMGAMAMLVAAALVALAGWGLLRFLPRFHPEFGSLTPAFYGEGWYMAGLAALAVTVVTLLQGLLARWTRGFPGALAAGALLPLVLGAVAAAAVVPLVAMELQVPALAGTLAAGVLALAGGRVRSRGVVRIMARGVVLLLAVVVLTTLVPLVEGIWVAMSLRLAVGLGVLVVIGLAAMLPALEALGEPNRVWAPLASLAVAGLLVGGGILQAGPSADRPLPSTLLHALDRESGEAVWATRDDPGFDWATEQVGAFGEPRGLEAFGLRQPYRTATAAVAPVPEPTVDVLAPEPAPVTFAETSRRIQLRVTSLAGAEIVSVSLEGGSGATGSGAAGAAGSGAAAGELLPAFTAMNGVPFPEGAAGSAGARRAVTRVSHQGRSAATVATVVTFAPALTTPTATPVGAAMPESGPGMPGLLLEVEVPQGTERLTLVIEEVHFRPAEWLGSDVFRRPPHLMASALARSDQLLVRTPVVVELGAWELDPGP